MTTKVINLKTFRRDITSIWKEAQKNNIKYIVLHHSKPIFEVIPSQQEELIFEDHSEQQYYYKTIEQNLDFWHDDKDDNIFKN